MVQKHTAVWVSDRSGAAWLQAFHLYRGSWRRYSSYGDYIKGAVKAIAFYPRYVWSRRYRPLRVGFVVRGLLTQARASARFVDNTRVSFKKNALVLLKKRGTFKSRTLYGPCVRLSKKRRYASLFDSFV